MTTIYEYNGKELFRDEADEYQVEDIRAHYAQFTKELLTSTYTVIPAEKEGEPRKVIFAKKVGTKGAAPPGPPEGGAKGIIAAILETPPAELDALAILNEFLGTGELPDPGELLRQAKRIEAALDVLANLSKRSGKVVELCLQAHPVPAQTLPPGF